MFNIYLFCARFQDLNFVQKFDFREVCGCTNSTNRGVIFSGSCNILKERLSHPPPPPPNLVLSPKILYWSELVRKQLDYSYQNYIRLKNYDMSQHYVLMAKGGGGVIDTMGPQHCTWEKLFNFANPSDKPLNFPDQTTQKEILKRKCPLKMQ